MYQVYCMKENFAMEQTMKTQRRNGGIALLFL